MFESLKDQELAEVVAAEIGDAFRAYNGPKWQQVDGQEKAVTFTIEAPSLSGRSVNELNPPGVGASGDFSSKLWSAGGHHRYGGGMTGRRLFAIRYQPEIVDGVYTGKVEVSDGSSAFDFDL